MKNALFLAVFFLTVNTVEAQVLFEESFEGNGIPAGWTINTQSSDGGWKTGTAAALSSDFFQIRNNDSGQIIATNDDACNCNKSNDLLVTPAIDLKNVGAAFLYFDSYFTDSNYEGREEEGTIEVSLDGINWTILEDLHGHGSWDTHIIDLSAYLGEDSVYIGFRYSDSGGWLFGFAIDNVRVEVPPALELSLVDIEKQAYGELSDQIPIKGTLYNTGSNVVESVSMKYTINGENETTEIFSSLDISSLDYASFEFAMPWSITEIGSFRIDVEILEVNGGLDQDLSNNSSYFETIIFEQVVVPNKISELLSAEPLIEELTDAGLFLDSPTDLDFFPILGKDELWVINQRNEDDGGSTLTILDATISPSDYLFRVDGNAWHFMSLPTALAFSTDNYNFASSPGVQDANHNGGTFTGPSLWSSDPEIYAQPSGGNGSHLDMLHGSPYSMGIAHERDNVFWVYDNWNGDIVRYDFVEDHGPGNDDHSDAIVRRYQNIGINADGNIPNHMILDQNKKWLYIVDNGNQRIIRLDIESGTNTINLPEINEPLAEHSAVTGFEFETIISRGLDKPCGIEIFENNLLVSDYANGQIIIYDINNDFFELGRLETISPGITGIKIGPDGNIWFTNRLFNSISCLKPQEVSSTSQEGIQSDLELFPNPSNGVIGIKANNENYGSKVKVEVFNIDGQMVYKNDSVDINQVLDLNKIGIGSFLVKIKMEKSTINRRLIITE